MQRIILHLDMNSYFASVEQQANPDLRGKPVGVVATMTPHGCILASSKEAKALGVKTGCRADEARFLCPGIHLLEVDPPKYRSTTERIFSIVRQYSDDIEPYSIDEAFINLTGFVDSFDEAVKVGKEIKQRIFTEVGEWLTNSMGIASTRWLAKFGSDTCTKGGIVILNAGNCRPYLMGRELTEAWGIGTQTARKLHALGICTLGELAEYSPYRLKRLLGIRGYELWAHLNAIEISPDHVADNANGVPKSIGHSHVVRKRTTDPRFARAVMMRLAERTGRRLRSLRMQALGIFSHVGFEDTPSVGGSVGLSEPVQSTEDIFRRAWRMIHTEKVDTPPNFFAMGVFSLQPITNQRSFFNFTHDATPELDDALDTINDRFGDETIMWGTLLGLDRYHAPDRIGFRKTVSWDIPSQKLMMKGSGTPHATIEPFE